MKSFLKTVLCVFALALAAQAAVPPCILGGPTAVNKDRKLADGERFVITTRPLVVNLEFRPTKKNPEAVGQCMLPTGSEVAVNAAGYLVWVKKCGNKEVNGNICIVEPCITQGPPGQPGQSGLQGPPGRPGETGPQGVPGIAGEGGIKFVDQDVVVAVTEGITPPERTETRRNEDGRVTQSVRVTIPASILRPPAATIAVVPEKNKQPGWCSRHKTGCGLLVGGGVVVATVGGLKAAGVIGGHKSLPNQDWPVTISK